MTIGVIFQGMIAVCSIIAVSLVFSAWYQIRAARKERLESLWDSFYQSGAKEIEDLGENEKIKDIICKDRRVKLRRTRHLYLERIEEALRIEKPPWYGKKDLKKRHKRVQEWYWRALNVYGDDIRVFEEVKVWHDYYLGDLDPLENGLRILNFLVDGEGDEEKVVQRVVDRIFEDLRKLEVGLGSNVKKEAKKKLKNRLQDLKDFGFVKHKRKLTWKKYWELSKEGKEVIGRKIK